MSTKRPILIRTEKLNLKEWLDLVNNPPENSLFSDYCFPTEKHKQEYLSSVHLRTDKDVKNLLRHFLIRSGSLGTDEFHFDYVLGLLKNNRAEFERLMEFEHTKRLFTGSPWEGITWVLDLLPHWPREALDGLDAYFLANCQVMPDGRIDGLSDAKAIIRAKYLGAVHPPEILGAIKPRNLEYLVCHLYHEMDYSVRLMQKTHDGGRDVIATKDKSGSREVVQVQCRTSKRKVPVQAVRELLGTVTSSKSNKGVLVSNSGFTEAAGKMAADNPRIELINGKDLERLLNEYVGPSWSSRIDDVLAESVKTYKRQSPGLNFETAITN